MYSKQTIAITSLNKSLQYYIREVWVLLEGMPGIIDNSC